MMWDEWVTEDDKDEFPIRWEIENFSFAEQQTGYAIQSQMFDAECLDDTRWFLSVYPRGKEDDEYVDVSVTRAMKDDGEDKIAIVFTIELEAADSSRRERRVSPESNFIPYTSRGFLQYIKRSTLLEDMKSTFLPDDTLTIHCTLTRVPSEVKYITEYICESHPETIKAELQWDVRKWSDVNRGCFLSDDVMFTEKVEAKFNIRFCVSDDSDKSVILELEHQEPRMKRANLRCDVSIVDPKGSEVLARTAHHSFSETRIKYTRKLFAQEEIKDSYIEDDVLKVRVVLSLQTGKIDHKMSQKVHEYTRDEDEELEARIQEEFLQDIEKMYESGENSNVKARVGSRVFDCHKSILIARSPVMDALLDKAEESLQEGSVCVIDIDDIDGDTLEQMLYFMYTNKIKNINLTSALMLFVAGHKYQINSLKDKCSLYLSEVLNFENVYDILMAAHLYEDGELKSCAINYISEYFSRICLTTEWHNFLKQEKELSADICREIRRMKNM